jgi:hypothetical protein
MGEIASYIRLVEAIEEDDASLSAPPIACPKCR